MGIVVVEVCDANIITEIDIEQIIESEFPEVVVMITTCLSFCGMCARSPYAIVNGKKIFAKTIDECLEKIRAHIKAELALYTD